MTVHIRAFHCRPISELIRIACYPGYTSTREFVESGIMCKASKEQFQKYGWNMKQVWASPAFRTRKRALAAVATGDELPSVRASAAAPTLP